MTRLSPMSQFPTPVDPSMNNRQRGLWVFLGLVVCIVAGFILWLINGSQYLKTQVVMLEQSGGEVDLVDDYTRIETYCQQEKEAHIVRCGDVLIEENYNCRTKGANDAFWDCMEEITIEMVEVEEVFDAEIAEGNTLFYEE